MARDLDSALDNSGRDVHFLVVYSASAVVASKTGTY